MLCEGSDLLHCGGCANRHWSVKVVRGCLTGSNLQLRKAWQHHAVICVLVVAAIILLRAAGQTIPTVQAGAGKASKHRCHYHQQQWRPCRVWSAACGRRIPTHGRSGKNTAGQAKAGLPSLPQRIGRPAQPCRQERVIEGGLQVLRSSAGRSACFAGKPLLCLSLCGQ